MKTDKKTLNVELNQFCSQIGKDRLLVQGGGGNVSWKDENGLWVKASGTCIGDAINRNIFVAVDLKLLKKAIASGKYDERPINVSDNSMRASIETMFHSILPQKYVVHLHEVNSLSRLVGKEAKDVCQRLMPDEFKFIFIEYHKPGADLARAIHKSGVRLEALDFIFLRNHGIIILDDKIENLSKKLDRFRQVFEIEPREFSAPHLPVEMKIPAALDKNFTWVHEPEIHALAVDMALLSHVKNNWVMYPDHAVFLGAHPCIVEGCELDELGENKIMENKFIFVSNVGVLKNNSSNVAEFEQLMCYSDVLRRIYVNSSVCNLELSDIASLLDWDAEKYRQRVSAQND
jgi:rhamnose utilization protein RhaD (predicted bifunctional aldolase and dehydrogenase)